MSNQQVKTRESDINNSAESVSTLELKKLVDDFEQLLIRESTLLQSANSDHISELAAQKQHVVDSLAEFEPQLITLFDQHSAESDVQLIKATLARCQQQNQNNQLVTQTVLKHTNNGLELLRSIQQMNDLSLYEPSGELNIKREQRHLGSA